MIFDNSPINLDLLPKVEEVSLQKLAPAYLRVSIIGSVIFLLFMLVGLSIIVFQLSKLKVPYMTPTIYSAWGVLAILTLWLTYRGFQVQGYALRAKDIIFRKGVLFQSLTTIPFNRVQHCEIKQGPIERYFNLKTLEIYTAGGRSSDLSISGLLPDEAQQLKEFIINNTVKDGQDEEE